MWDLEQKVKRGGQIFYDDLGELYQNDRKIDWCHKFNKVIPLVSLTIDWWADGWCHSGRRVHNHMFGHWSRLSMGLSHELSTVEILTATWVENKAASTFYGKWTKADTSQALVYQKYDQPSTDYVYITTLYHRLWFLTEDIHNAPFDVRIVTPHIIPDKNVTRGAYLIWWMLVWKTPESTRLADDEMAAVGRLTLIPQFGPPLWKCQFDGRSMNLGGSDHIFEVSQEITEDTTPKLNQGNYAIVLAPDVGHTEERVRS